MLALTLVPMRPDVQLPVWMPTRIVTGRPLLGMRTCTKHRQGCHVMAQLQQDVMRGGKTEDVLGKSRRWKFC